MITYLDRVGSTYYFRRVVPLELRFAILTRTGKPRTEWKFSLGTKDLETAKRLIPTHALETDRLLDEARQSNAQEGRFPARTAPSRSMTDAEYARFLHDQEGAEIAYREQIEKEERQEARAPLLARLRTAVRKSTAEITPEEAATRDLLREQAELSDAKLREAEAAVTRAEQRRGLGSPSQRTPVPARPHGSVPAVPHGAGANAPVPLRELFHGYASAQGIKPTTARDWRGAIGSLIAFLGHDDASRITAADLLAWRDALLAEDTSKGTKREARTVRNGYFAPIRATLNWAVENHKLPENVAGTVRVRVRPKAKLRERDFTTDEAKAILSAALEVNVAEGEFTALARRWVPWLCAYTGARVNEMSQLRAEDVTQIDGTWTIRITPEAGTVKANAARTVPLHSHLVEQGFPAVATARGQGPIFYDAGRIRTPGGTNRYFKKVGEKLAKWVRDDVGIIDPQLQPNHGWRHTFKTLSRSADMPERIADAIQGHAPRSVGQSYGSVPLRTLADAIEKLPRFDV